MRTREIIKQENDACRRALVSNAKCKIMLTPGVNESEHRQDILEAVRSFDAFTADNNPHGENDFGSVEVGGEKYFFKFDYYDTDLEYGVDPLEEEPVRVLTIMHSSEY